MIQKLTVISRLTSTFFQYLVGVDVKWNAEIETYSIRFSAFTDTPESGRLLADILGKKAKLLAASSLYTATWTLEALGFEIQRRAIHMTADEIFAWIDGINDMGDLLKAREEKFNL